MSRARILADYVSSGDELADKAPIDGPTFTGTVAIPNVANLETAVVANTAKVTNYNQTKADINALDITELGTVTSGNLSNSAIVYPQGHILQVKYMAYKGAVSIGSGAWGILLQGYYITIVKRAGTNVLLQWSTQLGTTNGSVGTYTAGSKIERATATNFGTGLTILPPAPPAYTNLEAGDTTLPSGSVGFNNQAQYNYIGNFGHTTMDEGITASAGTYYYRVQVKCNTGNVTLNVDAGVGTLTAMEVVA